MDFHFLGTHKQESLNSVMEVLQICNPGSVEKQNVCVYVCIKFVDKSMVEK